MNQTKMDYLEHFVSSMMNRLVESESNSLLEQYNMCKKEINKKDISQEKKDEDMENLDAAYEFVRRYINGTEEPSLIG